MSVRNDQIRQWLEQQRREDSATTLHGLLIASRPDYPGLSDRAILQLLEARTRPGSYDIALEKLGIPEPPAYTGVPRPYDLALARRKAGGR